MAVMTSEKRVLHMKEQLLRVGEERMVLPTEAIMQVGKLSKGVPRVA